MGIPPTGGGAYDAVNHALDVEEYDSPASGDTVEKSATDVGEGVEADLSTSHVFERVVLDSVDFAGATKFPSQPALFVDPTSGDMFAAWQAGATGSPTGIVAAWSTDNGVTWSAPAQVADLDPPFTLTAVIRPSDGDIHMCFGKLGLPARDGTDRIYYQVLSKIVDGWDLTGNLFTIHSNASKAASNPSLAVDRNGFLVVAFMEYEGANAVWLDTIVSDVAWNLTDNTFEDEFQLTNNVNTRIKLIWGDDTADDRWMMMIEIGGHYKLYWSTSVLSTTDHTLFWNLSQSYFEVSTDEFDMIHMPLPLAGVVGIVQKVNNEVQMRSWAPTGDVLGAPTVIEGDATHPCRYPAIMVDFGGEFIVVYTREEDTDDHQLIYQRSQNSGATWNVERHPLDSDSGGNHWGWLKMDAVVTEWDRLAVLWCDNALSPFDVHFGMAGIPVIRSVIETPTGVDTIPDLEVPISEDSVVSEAVAAGEPKAATDVGAGVESIGQDRPIDDVGEITEDLVLDPVQFEETAVAEETFPGGPSIPVTEAPSAAETLVQNNPLTLDEDAVGAETVLEADQELDTVQETAVGTDTITDQARGIVEAVRGLETFLEAEPNIVASIYDNVAGHTSVLFRLDTARWTEIGPQPGVAHIHQKLYHFKDANGMGAILFRRRGTASGNLEGPWSDLERSLDLGETWSSVLSNCADVVFGAAGVGFAIATGGDARAHKIYKSTDQGATWALVYTDAPNGTPDLEPPFYRITTDPADGDRVMVLGNNENPNIHQNLRILFTADGFDTDPAVRVNPIGGTFLLTYQRTLVGAASGRWVFSGGVFTGFTPRNKVYTSDDDGVTWILRLDQQWTIINGQFQQVLYEGGGNLFAVARSALNPIFKSTDNGTTWDPIFIGRVESPDAGAPEIILSSSIPLEARAIAYDRAADRLFVGVGATQFPVISLVAPQNGQLWINERANMVDVVGPGSTPASSLRCSHEGLIQVASLGEVRITMQDPASTAEIFTTLQSVLETVTVVDEIAEMVKQILEDAVGAETLSIELPIAETPTGVETLTLVLSISDLAAAVEVLTRTDELWLAVRILLHEGIAHLRLEGPSGSSVPGRGV